MQHSLVHSRIPPPVTVHEETGTGGSDDKELTCNAQDPGLIPGSGRSPGEGNGNTLQYSCLENSTDRGAWAAVHWVAEWLTLALFSISEGHKGVNEAGAMDLIRLDPWPTVHVNDDLISPSFSPNLLHSSKLHSGRPRNLKPKLKQKQNHR